MTTNVNLHCSCVIGGVFNGEAYTIFLGGGGLCVLPRYLVENNTHGSTPEERIEYIIQNGINSDSKNKRIIQENKQSSSESFLNLRNYE